MESKKIYIDENKHPVNPPQNSSLPDTSVFKVTLCGSEFNPNIDTVHAHGVGVNGGVLMFFLDSPDNIVSVYNNQEWKKSEKVLPKGKGGDNFNSEDADYIPKSRLNLN